MMDRELRLGVVFILNGLLLVGLISVGIVAHSLGVLAAAGDYFADALAIALSIVTVRLARRGPTTKRSFGFERTTILAATVNAALVVAAASIVVVEAIRRLVNPAPHIHGLPVVVISAVAAMVMLAGAMVLRGDDDLNVRSVLLDTASDAVTASGVALTGLVILVTGGLFWLDPAVALAIAVVIGFRATKLLREIAEVLLESTPKGLQVSEVEAVLLADGEICDVHDLHVWSLTSNTPLLSAHVVLAGHPSLEESQEVVERAKARLHHRFAIDHATLETECEPCATPDLHAVVPTDNSNASAE
jgi:cobalt-zinc-cadmium efflux system protein